MADVFSNERVGGSPEEEIKLKNNDEIDVINVVKADNEGSQQAAAPPSTKLVSNEQLVVVVTDKKPEPPDSQRTSSAKVSGEIFEKSISSSEALTERALQKKISKFVANSARHAVTNDRDKDFNKILREAVEAIKAGVYPKLIPAGSSGSYFVLDKDGQYLAVFKPKDEEPFADQNPKWPKFFQRVLCFCCFGRACLIPNNGYLSETGASLVDDRFNLNVVPKTRVVKLISPSFFYGRGCFKQKDVTPKEGSFQIFVHGYRSATEVLAEWTSKGDSALSLEENDTFVTLFHKMCVLDYVIRNTDRHTENWLIRHVPGEEISIAAIDNGLAFPVKHPECASRFRHFPFNWAELPFAKQPLHPELRERLLKLLTPLFVHNLCDDVKTLFRHDKNTSRLLSYSQIRVLRGQLYNLHDGLVANESPSEWTKREPILVTRKYRKRPTTTDWEKCFRKRPIDYTHRGCC